MSFNGERGGVLNEIYSLLSDQPTFNPIQSKRGGGFKDKEQRQICREISKGFPRGFQGFRRLTTIAEERMG